MILSAIRELSSTMASPTLALGFRGVTTDFLGMLVPLNQHTSYCLGKWCILQAFCGNVVIWVFSGLTH